MATTPTPPRHAGRHARLLTALAVGPAPGPHPPVPPVRL